MMPMKALLFGSLVLALIATLLPAQEGSDSRPNQGPVKVVPSVGVLYDLDWRHPDLGFRNPDGTIATVQSWIEPEQVDFASTAWQRGQLETIMEAEIDFLVLNWRYAADCPEDEISKRADQALGALLAAQVQIAKDGGKPPRLAMMIDGEVLAAGRRAPDRKGTLDLRDDKVLRAFEESLFHFYRRVPKGLRWELDGYPLLVIGPALGAAHDVDLFDRLARDFAAEFQARPYLVADPTWKARATARWTPGAALLGPQLGSEVVVIGPGYDDTRVPGRGTPLRKREDGRFYEWSWNKALLANPTLVLIETWNRFQEGSGIAPCKEYDDVYVGLTRRYVARLKGGLLPDLERPVRIAYPDPLPRPDRGWFEMQEGLDRVFWVAASHGDRFGFGLRLVEVEDGPFLRARRDDKAVLRLPESALGTYLYVGVADEFAHRSAGSYEVEVVCRGGVDSELILQYDSWDPAAILKGAYKSAPKEVFDDDGLKRLVWQLPDARFGNRQNGGSDFRLYSKGAALDLFGIQLRRLPERLRDEQPRLIRR